jgi:iron(III) transport system substrate-binding protein
VPLHRLLALLLAVALMAAACGDDDDTDTAVGADAAAVDDGAGDESAEDDDMADDEMADDEMADDEMADDQGAAGDVSGSLTWYSLQPTSATAVMVDAFTDLHPEVDVEVVNFQGPDILDRIGAEAQADVDSFDVVDMAGRAPLAPFSEQGLLATYEPDALARYPDDLATTVDGGDVWAFGGNSHGLCVNTDVVDDPPTSYEDLLEDRFTDEIVYGAPLGTGFGQTLTVESRGYWGEERWRTFWEGIGGQQVQIVDTPATAMDLLIRGERGVMLWCNISVLRSAVDRGAPIEWVAVNPDIANEVTVAMSADAESPEAAQAFIEFILGESGQNLVGEAFGLIPLLPGAPGPDVIGDAADVDVILTPSEFAIAELDGLSERDPAAYAEYVEFITQVFGL